MEGFLLNQSELTNYYLTMFTARQVDIIEQDYTSRGEAFFHVSGGGHEGGALLSQLFKPEDMLSIHYRDKALALARGVAPKEYFLALFNKEAADSRGRQMNAHLASAKHNIMSPTGPVGNSALHAAGAAETMTAEGDSRIVLCSLGDGMTQQGDVLESIAQAARKQLPILFFIQDNSFAISTDTKGKTFFSRPDGEPSEYYGIPITRTDGRYPEKLITPFKEVVTAVREQRKPQILIMKTERLDSHTNADDHRVYRSDSEIQGIRETGDPVENLRDYLISQGAVEAELTKQEELIRATLLAQVKEAQQMVEPTVEGATKRPLPAELAYDANEYRGTFDPEGYSMLEAIREVLRNELATRPEVELLGEDIADPKGDVFGVTKGLSTQFPGRVENSPLAEASIVGLSIGRALAGKHPVAFLQFSDFLPIAFNQIASELGSMYWRTDGEWEAPVIIMVSAGAYKPGLGPYHAASSEATVAHTPGVDVMYPSTAGDAAGMLRAAFKSKRPTIFFYPKIVLNEGSVKTSKDITKHLIPMGTGRVITPGKDLTMVTYGNGVKLAAKATETLKQAGISAELIDLRCITPWDIPLVVASAEKTGRVIIIHEENRFGGVGAEIAAELAEQVSRPIIIRRVTRPDTFVPCNFGSQLRTLPSYKKILTTAVEVVGGTLTWEEESTKKSGSDALLTDVEIIGTSPADEQAAVVEWHVAPGDTIEEGALIADIEADKAAGEMNSPLTGVVEELLLEEGVPVPVGTPALRIKPTETTAAVQDGGNAGTQEKPTKAPTREITGTPIITLPAESVSPERTAVRGTTSSGATIIDIASSLGSRTVTNQEIAELCPQWTPESIESSIGIKTRQWATKEETPLSLAVTAAKEVLSRHNLKVEDLSQIICTTGTPGMNTPSLAARIQYELLEGRKRTILCPVLDISAACSGYVYGLQMAWDTLQYYKDGVVLLITSEVLSPFVDSADHTTAPIFGDGATATLLGGTATKDTPWVTFTRPITAGAGEPGTILKVPSTTEESIFMDGKQVYLEAVHHMIELLKRSCTVDNRSLAELSCIVPHQANQKIIDAVRKRLKLAPEKVYSEIAHRGNTSSCTIPLALESIKKSGTYASGELLGISAFGGGFTSGSGILEIV